MTRREIAMRSLLFLNGLLAGFGIPHRLVEIQRCGLTHSTPCEADQ